MGQNGEALIVDAGNRIARRAPTVPKGSPRAASVEAAETAVATLAKDYASNLARYVGDLTRMFDRLEARPVNKRQSLVDEIAAAALDIAELTGTFGFELITRIAGSLHNFLEAHGCQLDEEIALAQRYLGLMQNVLDRRIYSPESPAGKKVLDDLQRLDDCIRGAA